jgi:hypothetical protein
MGEGVMSLYDRIVEEKKVGCHDRMRDRYRPDIPGEKTSLSNAERMADLARGLADALQCREKDKIARYMTLLGKNLVDVKGMINSKQAKHAYDYETKIMFPERARKARQKAAKREPARSRR